MKKSVYHYAGGIIIFISLFIIAGLAGRCDLEDADPTMPKLAFIYYILYGFIGLAGTYVGSKIFEKGGKLKNR